jgi:hypothetical protein
VHRHAGLAAQRAHQLGRHAFAQDRVVQAPEHARRREVVQPGFRGADARDLRARFGGGPDQVARVVGIVRLAQQGDVLAPQGALGGPGIGCLIQRLGRVQQPAPAVDGGEGQGRRGTAVVEVGIHGNTQRHCCSARPA